MQIANLVNLKSGLACVCVYVNACACACTLVYARRGKGRCICLFVFPWNRTVSKGSTGCLLLLINGAAHFFEANKQKETLERQLGQRHRKFRVNPPQKPRQFKWAFTQIVHIKTSENTKSDMLKSIFFFCLFSPQQLHCITSRAALCLPVWWLDCWKTLWHP